jgi:L-ribulose-5-phosphate 3-epimerase
MALNASQIGVCSWSLKPKSAQDLVEQLKLVDLKTIQLSLSGLVKNEPAWADSARVFKDAGITIASGMIGNVGEDYTTLETIRETGGVILDKHWDQNWANAQAAARVAQSLGLTKVSTHAGFLVDDQNDPIFKKLFSRLKQIADMFKDHGLELVFETGQETADTLSKFLDALEAAGTHNVRVNFDPANMILYGKGDPIASLRKLLPRVSQVHIKDAVSTQVKGTWGKEVAAGKGEVDWPAFISILKEADFKGGLIIEREAGETRIEDVKTAAALIANLIKG